MPARRPASVPRAVPRLAAVSCAIAALILLVLAVAVGQRLGTGGSGHQHSASEALYRTGASPLHPLLGSALVRSWQLDAVAVAVLVMLAALYLTGVALAGVRGTRWPLRNTASFLAGLAVCGFATNGSIAVYDQALFTAHMAGHLALVMVAPALLMYARPLRLTLAACRPDRAERVRAIATGRVVSVLTAPPVALASYAAVIVGSHLTGVMDEVMRVTWAGQVEHLVYLVVGCQFFVLIVGDEPIRWLLSAPARWLLLAIAMAVDTFTGVVLLQGTRAVHLHSVASLHVAPLSDTHTGGAIMWFGGDAIMAVVMIVVVIDWLRHADAPQAKEPGWLELARRSTFSANTEADNDTELDDDDAARESYNEWLARLNRGG